MTTIVSTDPKSAGWQYLSAAVHQLEPAAQLTVFSDKEESLIVLVEGSVDVAGGDVDERLDRESPWRDVSSVVYVPPRTKMTITAVTNSEVSIGSAPSDGQYEAHVVSRDAMHGEVRGGGAANRQVVTTFGPTNQGERLISYEAWVPRGSWTGWPPHKHDGTDGSPYLEETYYYRFDGPSGFGFHRNFDSDQGFDDVIPIRDRSLVTVPRGYHLCTAGPPANVWVLNFLAGSPDDRRSPPLFDERETWINEDWNRGLMKLPAVLTTPTDVEAIEG